MRTIWNYIQYADLLFANLHNNGSGAVMKLYLDILLKGNQTVVFSSVFAPYIAAGLSTLMLNVVCVPATNAKYA